jgi:hypothetical protein
MVVLMVVLMVSVALLLGMLALMVMVMWVVAGGLVAEQLCTRHAPHLAHTGR